MNKRPTIQEVNENMKMQRKKMPRPKSARAEKSDAPKRFRIRYVVIGFLIVIAMAVYLMLTHKFFDIKYVKVEGNVNVQGTKIAQAMGETNKNVFLYNTEDAKNKILAVPGINTVEIKKELPNRMYVTVTESYLLGSLELNGQMTYVDQNGVIQNDLPEQMTNKAPMPQLEGFSSDLKVGDHISSDQRVIQFLQIVMQSDLIGDIKKINFENDDNIDIMYRDIAVHFGPLNDLLKKMQTLETVVADVNKRGIVAKEILLNSGENPIVVTE